MLGVSPKCSRRAAIIAGAAGLLQAPGAIAQGGGLLVRNDLRAPVGNGFGPAPQKVDQEVIVIETPASPMFRNGYREPEAQYITPNAVHRDWRRAILVGERTMVARRSGSPVERITYANADGSINAEGYRRICFLLRDIRANQVADMDIGLINMLYGLQRWAGINGVSTVLHFTSGLRTSTTNAATEGAAKNSLHKDGRAADFLMEGIKPAQLGAMVRTFNAEGGTGIYQARGFVHADTGRSRVWHG